MIANRKKSRQLSFRISESLYNKLHEIRQESFVTLSDIFDEALNEYIRQYDEKKKD